MQQEHDISAITFGRMIAKLEALTVTVQSLEKLLTTKHDDHETRLRMLEGVVSNFRGLLVGACLGSSAVTGLAFTLIQLWLKTNG